MKSCWKYTWRLFQIVAFIFKCVWNEIKLQLKMWRKCIKCNILQIRVRSNLQRANKKYLIFYEPQKTSMMINNFCTLITQRKEFYYFSIEKKFKCLSKSTILMAYSLIVHIFSSIFTVHVMKNITITYLYFFLAIQVKYCI